MAHYKFYIVLYCIYGQLHKLTQITLNYHLPLSRSKAGASLLRGKMPLGLHIQHILINLNYTKMHPTHRK